MILSWPMQNIRVLGILLICLTSAVAAAQKEEIFGSGKPPTFREETLDRRFLRSQFAKALAQGNSEPECTPLLGGLFLALAEIAPTLHKRDENFTLPPTIQEALQTQLSTPHFPALAYLISMVRRVMLDKRLPDGWYATAEAVNKKTKLIDLAKLKTLSETLEPVDSAYFTIPVLKERYQIEVLDVHSAVAADVRSAFRDTYLDRDVAWSGATLIDIGINRPKNKKKKRIASAEPDELVALLQWAPPKPPAQPLDLVLKPPPPPPSVLIAARLKSRQYADIDKFRRGQRVLIKGRLWEMNDSLTELEIRDGLLFEDRDWSEGVLLATPQDVAQCGVAINELTGLAPDQPGGFGH